MKMQLLLQHCWSILCQRYMCKVFCLSASHTSPFCPLAEIGFLRRWQAQSTYLYRVQSSVWRLPNYWPPPLHPASVSSPRTKGGGHTLAGQWEGGGQWWGVNISEDTRHWIGLLQYNPSTVPTLCCPGMHLENSQNTKYEHLKWS